ncbi:amidohydrolase/deacetylase family metallohydrolase [Erysipelothrix sp. HDW6C]|uniref:amidohydrolase/deacetylase family metallohydrolase n=1 Tax=Erysipelothrix sp. HDW6C TaxID=2714930 RepID=UPI00140D2613|nr:amidohydrolase/deacetylase family metallohydrolase [Erysipelothrix sp. HDW6C]QIK69886.1 amidohydrolase/deacetylase family metallohydrolase [Erysipelothrix sp. HDW6C]
MLHLINGQTLNNEPIEVLVDNETIVAIAPKIEGDYEEVYDLQGRFISAGWIDMHTHCYERFDLYYDDADEVGYKTGVTSVVDAGTTGADDIDQFYQDSQSKITRVFALLNISKLGIKQQDELSDMHNIDDARVADVLKRYPHFVIGLKARMSASVIGNNGIKPLDRAKTMNRLHQVPLMVHIGSNPPLLVEILERLEAGDIVTHIFNGKDNGILNEFGKVRHEVIDAHNRGVIFDIGHGRDSFDFDVAQQAFKECVFCDTISSDIYHENRKRGPVYDLATTMNKMLTIGYSPIDVISMVTSVPARVMHLNHLGLLEKGKTADITIFTLDTLNQQLVDSNGSTRETTHGFKPVGVVVKGKVYEL